MCFVWLSEQTVTFALHNINRLISITKVESVYSAVQTESLYNTDTLSPFQEITCLSNHEDQLILGHSRL